MLERLIEQDVLAKRSSIDYFIYSARWNTLTGAETETQNIPLNNDSAFLLRALTGTAYSSANTPLVDPDVRIQIMDTSTGRNWQNNPIHWSNMIGDARRPYYLPEPKLIPGGGNIAITLENIGGVAALIDISLIGYKVFNLQQFFRDWYR